MKTKIFTIIAAIALSFTPVLVNTTHAQDLNAIRSSMAKRLPQVDALKKQGALGENNQGYLTVREDKNNASSVATAENSDRKVVYESIAKSQKSTAAEVGKARARQIAQNSSPGIWLQDENGNWRQK